MKNNSSKNNDKKKEVTRVLQMVGSLGNAGVEAVIMNYYRNIDKDKVQFDFIVCSENKQKYDDEILRMGGKIYRLPSRNRHTLKYISKLAQILKQGKYEIFHVNSNSASCVIDLMVAKFCKVPVRIAHSHNSSCILKFQHYLLKPFLNLFATDRFACSNYAGKWLYGKKDFTLINNAVDIKKFEFNLEYRKGIREKLNLSDEEFVIGTVGRISEQKNPLFMINCFSEILKCNSNVRLLIVGDGELREDAKVLAQHLKIEDKIIFTGNVNNVNEWYSAMDLFCMPSKYEGLACSLIEAQTNGLDCVISNCIANEAIINKNVFVCPINEGTDIWKDTIIKLIKFPKEHIDAKENISKCGYDISKEKQKLEDFYLKNATNKF